MNIIPHSRRYLSHTIDTRYFSVKLYRSGFTVNFVCRKYHISKASLMRWNKGFDGSRQSLADGSHRPLSPHPTAHTPLERKGITDLYRRNPHISLCEMYGKLRSQKGYSRHPGSLYRISRALGFSSKASSTKKKRKPMRYDTPTRLGVKWQMDVKHVPRACYVGKIHEKFYQYTMIDEASGERFLYPYIEQSSYSTNDFVRRAIAYFGYKPETIQTDNGFEFTYAKAYPRTHPFDLLCDKLGINHKLIRPRTPWNNGKVERSHRNDQERFYNFLRFYSLSDLKEQMYRYRRRANRIPMAVLGWVSPIERRAQLDV